MIEKVTYTAIKLSVLFLYRRIFGVDTRFRSITSVFIILIVLWGTLFLFLESFLCISAGPKSTGCAKQEWALLWFAITEVLGDIAILSLPYPQIRKLQMSGREKIGVAATFALGTLWVCFLVFCRTNVTDSKVHHHRHHSLGLCRQVIPW